MSASSASPGSMATAATILSVPRLTTLFSSLIVALGSGTNYVYSAYAPQLGVRLGISHTKLNVIGLAGNVGVYSTGPPWGKIVDRRGPRILLATGFVSLLIGYSGIRYFYDGPATKIPDLSPSALSSAEKLSPVGFALLVFCSFLTGAGGNAGLTSSMNATAKTFPDQMRATTTGLVISGFGLSAFFFSTISHLLYAGDTSSFLRLLALGTSLPMILGFFFVRPIPFSVPVEVLPEHNPRNRRASISDLPDDAFAHAAGVDGVLGRDSIVYEHVDDSHTNLLVTHHNHLHLIDDSSEYVHEDQASSHPPVRSHSLELQMSPPTSRARLRSSSRVAHGRSASRVIEIMQDIHGRNLLRKGDFWLLFTLLSLLSGTGLMYINNVGSVSQALYSKGNPQFDEIESAKWQSMQVSILSIANCAGRIVIGLTADTVKNVLRLPRSYCICLVAALFVGSQLLLMQIQEVEGLWYASALVGLAYGGVFGLFPTITIEWFGLGHFSENWGFVSVSPMIGGNLFSLWFGHNLDKHAERSVTLNERAGLPSSQHCLDGQNCYVSSLYLTAFACSLAFVLSLFAAWKDRRRMNITGAMKEIPDVIWEEEEE